MIAEFSSFSWADARIHVVLSLLCTGDFIQVYHPNVDPRTGLVCLDFLTDKNWWTPVWTVDKILLVVVSLLHEPVMDGGAINREAAYLYKRKRLVYEEIARATTWQHASASAAPRDEPSSSSEKERRPSSSRGFSQLWHRLMRRVASLRSSGISACWVPASRLLSA